MLHDKKPMKRLWSLLLVVAMMISMLPMITISAGAITVADAADLVNKLNNASGTLEIDLGGKTYEITQRPVIPAGVNLTIKNGTIQADENAPWVQETYENNKNSRLFVTESGAGNIRFENVVFDANHITGVGQVKLATGKTLTCINCTFKNGKRTDDASVGLLVNHTSSNGNYVNATFTGCSFIGNEGNMNAPSQGALDFLSMLYYNNNDIFPIWSF